MFPLGTHIQEQQLETEMEDKTKIFKRLIEIWPSGVKHLGFLIDHFNRLYPLEPGELDNWDSGPDLETIKLLTPALEHE
jgi:hypothetical protein